MTIILAVEKNPAMEVTFECERDGYYAAVYENWGGEWHQTHESQRYKDREKAKAAYRRFVKRYIK